MQRAMQGMSNPYGLSPGGQANFQGFNQGNRPGFNPYGQGFGPGGATGGTSPPMGGGMPPQGGAGSGAPPPSMSPQGGQSMGQMQPAGSGGSIMALLQMLLAGGGQGQQQPGMQTMGGMQPMGSGGSIGAMQPAPQVQRPGGAAPASGYDGTTVGYGGSRMGASFPQHQPPNVMSLMRALGQVPRPHMMPPQGPPMGMGRPRGRF
jgi:hypothetical protein